MCSASSLGLFLHHSSYVCVHHDTSSGHNLCVPSKLTTMVDSKDMYAKLHFHSQAHRVLVERDVQEEAHRLCEAVTYYMADRANQVIQKADGNPIIYWYSNDGTPVLARGDIDHGGAHPHCEKGQQGAAHEFLFRRAMTKTTDLAGSSLVAVVVKPPVPLAAGKCMGHFSAACQFFPVVRKLAPTGIVVNAFCFDRAMFSALAPKTVHR